MPFLSLKSSAFDLTDRGVSGRTVPAGADAFVYAERGVYRSGETVYLTALLRDGQGNAVMGGPPDACHRTSGRCRISPRRTGGPRRGRPQPHAAAEFGGSYRDMAGAGVHRPEGFVGR